VFNNMYIFENEVVDCTHFVVPDGRIGPQYLSLYILLKTD
jgi:hypothetical protein